MSSNFGFFAGLMLTSALFLGFAEGVRYGQNRESLVGVVLYRSTAAVSSDTLVTLPALEQDFYRSTAQSVFDSRCIQCHSCNNAPCQLNLTSYEGVLRGAHKTPAVDPERLSATAPTRLGIDAQSVKSWRALGFHSILDGTNPYNTILRRMVSIKSIAHKSNPKELDPLYASTSHQCASGREFQDFVKARPFAGMPYNLTPLTTDEEKKLTRWIAAGMPGPKKSLFEMSEVEQLEMDHWLEFFNSNDKKRRLVARYLYEHLFLAHLYFSAEAASGSGSNHFFRLVRSSKPCDSLREIPTRRPIDPPVVDGSILREEDIFYCFKKFEQTSVEKTHLPYLLDEKKRQWVEHNFFDTKWDVKVLPGYDLRHAANPFRIFRDIPVLARYRFLLEDSHYHVATFIKGPVCNGSRAVSAIDEHFFVFFTSPEYDLMVKDSKFAKQTEELLVLPAELGTNLSVLAAPLYVNNYVKLRNKYRELRNQVLMKYFPKGLPLESIWDGGSEKSSNAGLTVFRHEDHSYVLKGLRGEPSHSVFVLDYALFERLVYNLTVGFDLYGNISHQFHTRVYMGMIRTEGETNFMEYMPASQRQALKNYWYSASGLRAFERSYEEAPLPLGMGSQITTGMKSAVDTKNYLISTFQRERVSHLFALAPERMNAGPLSGLAGKEVRSGGKWVLKFPDTLLVIVEDSPGGQIRSISSVLRNRRYSDIGSLFFSSTLRDSSRDSLIITSELATSYPNYFFFVPEAELSNLVSLLRLGNWRQAQARWGRDRLDPRFWKDSDRMHEFLKATMGHRFGFLDYTRYGEFALDR